ncbi:hypothetical protein GCM10011374_10380 [Kocuria dechangensis]|uniref:Uncharacterized protein n=1 Tax=Kocuria dechangensis TaxID=1176249 RepID=A0A917GKW6_9MICC|nr:DUF6541 family protein [Kocuria dechangensis]GGG49816.1 hypothetical protein GCM10011374_10380 [Kocuria dechangensis]
MTWIEALPSYLLVAVLLILPGLLLTQAIGLRGLLRAAAAVPLTVAALAASAVLFGFAGVPWSALTVGAAVLLVSGVLFLLLRLPRLRARGAALAGEDDGAGGRGDGVPADGPMAAPGRSARATTAALWCAAVLGAGLVAHRLTLILVTPDAVSQTYDNNFHLNAVRYIVDTGRASSLTLGGLGATDPTFYPGAWHDAVALLVQTTGLPVLPVVNATTFVLAAGVWTLGSIFLVTRVLGDRPVTVVAAGLVLTCFPAFPYLLTFYGVLFPNLMSMVMIPLLLGLLAEATGLAVRDSGLGPAARWTTILAVVGAMGLAHPSSVLVCLLLLLLMLVVAWSRRARRPGAAWWTTALGAAGLVAYGLVLDRVWESARASRQASTWEPHVTAPQALGEALAGVNPRNPELTWGLVVLVLIGLAVLARTRSRWVVGGWAVLVWLYLTAAAQRDLDLRYDWTGVWYNDAQRLAALVPVLAVPVATAGAAAVAARAAAGLRGLAERRGGGTAQRLAASPAVQAGAGLLAVLLGFVVLQGAAMTHVVRLGDQHYGWSGYGSLLTPQELALLERLDQEVPEGDVVFGNPLTGTGLAYGIGGTDVLIPHPGLLPDDDGARLLVRHLDDMTTQPGVCEALAAHDVRWVLDFGDARVNPYAYFDTRGYDTLIPERGFELVDAEGPDAALYRITGCPGL